MTKQAYVVLLHGIGRTFKVMRKLEAGLMQAGYTVFNDNYASTGHTIEKLAEHVYMRIQKACPNSDWPLHFVTYSMGGLVARFLIGRYRPSNLGRMVMIAPPNKGSEVADFMKRFHLYRRKFGPAGLQLGTAAEAILHKLKPIDYEVGIIAGTRTVDPLFSWFLLPGKNDGKVTVESTKLAGMKDHIILRASHTFLPSKKQTLLQVKHFLSDGAFVHG